MRDLLVMRGTAPTVTEETRLRARREKAIRIGAQKMRSNTLEKVESEWKVALKTHFGENDLLADGIGYRCSNSVQELMLDEDHFAWDTFQRYYGDTCMMVSTRALQTAGFVMDHGNRWTFETYHYSDSAKGPWDWHADWVIQMWIWALEPEQRDRLREDERWPEPSGAQRTPIQRFESGEWALGDDEERWNALPDESLEAFGALFEAAFESAPWWVLRYISDYGSEPELLEFTSRPPRSQWDGRWKRKMLGCILAIHHDEKLLYALPTGIKPGCPMAQRIASAYFHRRGLVL